MRSDENASSKKQGDMTADELLALLNKSIENKSEPKNVNPSSISKPKGELKIDDSVYKSAEDKLHSAHAFTATDDSDLDIDALIDKYITKPKEEREAAAKAEAETVSEGLDEAIIPEVADENTAILEDSSDSLLAEPQVEPVIAEVDEVMPEEELRNEPVDEIDEAFTLEAEPVEIAVETEEALIEEAADEVSEEVPAEITEETAIEDAVEAAEVLDEEIIEEIPEEPTGEIAEFAEDVDDIDDIAAIDGVSPEAVIENNESGDVVIYEPEAEDETVADGIDDDMAIDTQTTAVFDISKVKSMASDEDDIDSIVDEAFSMSETEIFTPVNAEAEMPEDAVSDEPAIYGDPDSEEIDQTDLNIMVAFGMDEELKEAVGEEKALEIEDDIIQRHEETAQMQAVAGKLEYTTREQNTEILTGYKSKYYTLIIRMAAAFGLMVVLFLIENFSMLGMSLPGFMRPTSYPMVYAMVDLQLVVLCGVLAAKPIIDGVRGIISLKPIPESITAFILAASVIYSFVAGITAPTEGFGIYNLPAALAVVLTLLYEFMNLKRDVFSFNVVSSRKKKFVVTEVSDSTESLERGVFAEYVSPDAQIVRVGKTDFVDGFFSRVDKDKIPKPIIGILLPAVLIIAAIFLILSFIRTGSVYEAFTMAFVTVAVTTPLAAFVIYSYPFYKASKDSYDNDSAIIGECSLGEYSGSAVISFEDKEVFPSGGVKVTSIKVYGQNRIDEIIYSLASAFLKVGGPLADVFSQATHDLGHSDDVELIEVDDDGLTVTIDGVIVYLGKASYMEKKDFDTPYDSENARMEQNAVGILYVAYEGQLAAKVYVQYTIDAEFESILAQLYKTGLCVGIKSFDPNIDDLLLAKKIKTSKYPVKVIRSKNVEDIPHTFERSDSGIVSKRSVKALLRTVALCERVSSVIRTNMIVKVLAMLIGVVVMVFINAFGGASTLSSLYLMLYQLFWIIPVMIISRFLV